MPIYEYRCDSCGREFEHLVFGEGQPEKCQFCDGTQLTRMISTCGFISKSDRADYTGSASQSSCGGCTSSDCAGCK